MFILDLKYPANAGELSQIFMLLASFNLIPTDDLFDNWFNLDETDPLTLNFEQMGFESQSLYKNMGFIVIVLVLQLIAVTLLSLVALCLKETPHHQRILKFKENLTFGNQGLMFVMESYMEGIISILVHYNSMSMSTSGEKSQTIFNFYTVAIYAGIPLYWAFYMFYYKVPQQYQDDAKRTKKVTGHLFEGL